MLPLQQSTHFYTKPITCVFEHERENLELAWTRPCKMNVPSTASTPGHPRPRPVGKRQDGKSGRVPVFEHICIKTHQELKREVRLWKWQKVCGCKPIRENLQQRPRQLILSLSQLKKKKKKKSVGNRFQTMENLEHWFSGLRSKRRSLELGVIF